MSEYTKDEALAIIQNMRLTIGNRVGFHWLAEKLSALTAYIEALATENQRLYDYLDWRNARQDYQEYCARLEK